MEWYVILSKLLGGLGVSLSIFLITLLFSLPLGLFISFGRMSRNPILQNLSKIYISIMRGTPLMLQLFVVYYGLRPLLHFQNPTPSGLPDDGGLHRFCIKLCRLFCGDLPLGNPGNGQGAAGGSRNSRL